MSAQPTTPPLDSAERLAMDLEAAHATLCDRISSLLRPLARDGVSLDLEVHIRGKSVTTKTDLAPRGGWWDGQTWRRKP